MADSTIKDVSFLMGEGEIVLIVDGRMPPGSSYTVAATPANIRLKAGWDEFASIPYRNDQVFEHLTRASQIGVVEYSPPEDVFPNSITHVAYVTTMRNDL